MVENLFPLMQRHWGALGFEKATIVHFQPEIVKVIFLKSPLEGRFAVFSLIGELCSFLLPSTNKTTQLFFLFLFIDPYRRYGVGCLFFGGGGCVCVCVCVGVGVFVWVYLCLYSVWEGFHTHLSVVTFVWIVNLLEKTCNSWL